jgi:ribosomal protein S12 methylthiotransferase
LQHIDDRILKGMHRKGNSKEIRRLIETLRTSIPALTLRTTFIVGFPGENAGSFERLRSFIEEVEFDRLGIFAYSPEEGTPAFPLGDPVPAKIKSERRDLLLKLQAKISRKKLRRKLGEVIEVRVDGPSAETDLLLEGRMAGQAPEIDGVVYINDLGSGSPPKPGDLVPVRITAAHTHDLVGEIVHERIDANAPVNLGILECR